MLKHREVMQHLTGRWHDPQLHAKSSRKLVYGSDAPETAAIEIAQFFSGNESRLIDRRGGSNSRAGRLDERNTP